MNIIEKVRAILESFPKISEVCNSIHIDFADPEPTSYGLSSTGDQLISEDILGNQRRQHSFLLYSTYSSINDYERLNNSTALTELCVWLKEQTGEEVETEYAIGTPATRAATIEKILEKEMAVRKGRTLIPTESAA